ncbi:outer membrane transport energization protein TonB [Chitinophaga jiangningensis]|uniref:Outer membrane transport energization protein TonB n=1 Tax=Chitinophaga jiangningensis TaxID=1419482 RepID=A0A1M7FAM1_9BACT|nr:energy transducer TonB [Chitinophaga jiangningensis]SHM01066.1 outer membrane transport energization protein TonB [Chitinophaga jiangningensis]
MEKYFLHHLVEKQFTMDATKIPREEFLDILFAGRNKDYGAYELRSRYDRRVRNAVIVTASMVMVLVGGYLANISMAADKEAVNPFVYKPIAPIDPIMEQPDRTPPPPPPPVAPAPPPAAPTSQFVAPVVASGDQATDLPPQEELRNNVIGFENKEGVEGGADVMADLSGDGGNKVVTPPISHREEGPVSFVEIMPEFPGGEAALAKYLQKAVHYPRTAQENDIMGTVFVKFVVGKDGNITDLQIMSQRKGGGLEEEALRVVGSMPKWKPGRQNGQNVAVYFTLPIRFELSRDY